MPGFNLEKLSREAANYATFFSMVVSVVAITIGIQQFSKTTAINEEQIKMLKEERLRNFQEGRPILALDSTVVDVPEAADRPSWALQTWSSFRLNFTNIGTRPANNIIVTSRVIGAIIEDENEWLKEDLRATKQTKMAIIYDAQDNLYLPVLKDRVMHTSTTINTQGFKQYYIRYVISYQDKLDNERQYVDTFYLRNSWITFPNDGVPWEPANFFQGIDRNEIPGIDSIFSLELKTFNYEDYYLGT